VGKDTISTFIVPKDAPGVEVGENLDKMAFHAVVTNEVFLEDCRIPEENLLGDPNLYRKDQK
jgi:alkylation response protein AidB-like acyl-CoA dehydrogenase